MGNHGRTFKEIKENPTPIRRGWVGAGVLPRQGKVLLGGEAKVGKSWINIQLCKNLGTGTPLFGHPAMTVDGEPAVLYIESEISTDQMDRRIIAMCEGLKESQLERLVSISHDSKMMLDSIDGQKRIREAIEYHKPNVVIFDPIGKLIRADSSDETVINAVCKFFDELIEENRERDMSVVFSHHYKKPQTQRSSLSLQELLDPYNFRGSSILKNDPDAIATFITNGPKPLPDGGWYLVGGLVTRVSRGVDPFHLKVNMDGPWGIVYDGDAGDDNWKYQDRFGGEKREDRPLPRSYGPAPMPSRQSKLF